MPDYTIPPWIVNPPNYSESFAKGVSAGSQISHNYLQGMMAAQDRMKQEALLPLQQQEMQDHIKGMALDLQMKQDARRDFLAGKEQEAGLLEVASGIGDWSQPAVEMGIRQYGAENPQAIDSPIYGELLKRTQTAQKEKATADLLRARADFLYQKPDLEREKMYEATDRAIEVAKLRASSGGDKRTAGFLAHYDDDMKAQEASAKANMDGAYRLWTGARAGADSEKIAETEHEYRLAKNAFTNLKNQNADRRMTRLKANKININLSEDAPADSPAVPVQGKVRVRDAQGHVGTIDRANLPEALKRGATALE